MRMLCGVQQSTSREVDLVFLYDRSGSMGGSEVETELDFIQASIKVFDRIVASLQVRILHCCVTNLPSAVRKRGRSRTMPVVHGNPPPFYPLHVLVAQVGVVRFATDVAVDVLLTPNVTGALATVSRLDNENDGFTNTAGALEEYLSLRELYGRANASKLCVVISDGDPSDIDAAIAVVSGPACRIWGRRLMIWDHPVTLQHLPYLFVLLLQARNITDLGDKIWSMYVNDEPEVETQESECTKAGVCASCAHFCRGRLSRACYRVRLPGLGPKKCVLPVAGGCEGKGQQIANALAQKLIDPAHVP